MLDELIFGCVSLPAGIFFIHKGYTAAKRKDDPIAKINFILGSLFILMAITLLIRFCCWSLPQLT